MMHKIPTISIRPFISTLLLSVLLLGASSSFATLVGNMEGEFSVSKGAAKYHLPITVAPGVNGMEPNLSLNYSSQGSNGSLGVGWSLGGISAIHRCGSNLADDGVVRGVDFTEEDNYCLDGQRLVDISTTGTTSEYRTQIESHSRITPYNGTPENGPDYWTVETKDGNTLIYGGDGADLSSRLKVDGQLIVADWYLSKVVDKAGNEMTIFYDSKGDVGRAYPIRYEYGDRYLDIAYEPSPDARVSYKAGSKQVSSQRISQITNRIGAAAVMRYEIDYVTSAKTGRSLLNQITQCATPISGLEQCLSPTTFEWQGDTLFTGYGLSESSTAIATDEEPQYADVDGDGVVDLIKVKTDGAVTIEYAKGTTASVAADATMDQVSFVDMNGDGRADFVRTKSDGSGKVYYGLGGGGISSAPDMTFVSSFGAFGEGEIIQSHFVDLDGDAIADMIQLIRAGAVLTYVNTSISNGAGMFQHGDYRISYPLPQGSYLYVADGDGDGLSDLLYLKLHTSLLGVDFVEGGIHYSQGNGGFFNA